jgi:hypothetical protein
VIGSKSDLHRFERFRFNPGQGNQQQSHPAEGRDQYHTRSGDGQGDCLPGRTSLAVLKDIPEKENR